MIVQQCLCVSGNVAGQHITTCTVTCTMTCIGNTWPRRVLLANEGLILNLHGHGYYGITVLTHWGRVTHICVGNLVIIGSDNGLLPGQCQAITWTNAVILLIGPLGTNFSEILIVIHTFSFKKIYLKMSSGKWRPFCLGLNVLISWQLILWRHMPHLHGTEDTMMTMFDGLFLSPAYVKYQHLKRPVLCLIFEWFGVTYHLGAFRWYN